MFAVSMVYRPHGPAWSLCELGIPEGDSMSFTFTSLLWTSNMFVACAVLVCSCLLSLSERNIALYAWFYRFLNIFEMWISGNGNGVPEHFANQIWSKNEGCPNKNLSVCLLNVQVSSEQELKWRQCELFASAGDIPTLVEVHIPNPVSHSGGEFYINGVQVPVTTDQGLNIVPFETSDNEYKFRVCSCAFYLVLGYVGLTEQWLFITHVVLNCHSIHEYVTCWSNAHFKFWWKTNYEQVQF